MRATAWRLLALLALVAGLVAVAPPGQAAPAPAARHRHPPRATAELTLQMRDLFVEQSEFGTFDRMRASAILARPTDGLQDPEGEGYTRRAAELCNHRICVHYVTGGQDAPRSKHWVRHTLHTMTAVWHHEIGVLGFRKPPPDGRRGGDRRFDVYLTDLGSRGLFGYCTPERKVPGERFSASGYCVLDNDFARKQYGAKPQVSLEVTAAHEFFHAIQFGYDYRADPWLMESTAVWMEESFADSANDNRRYLPYGDLAKPWVPLDRYSDTGYSQYGNWAFWQYLTDKYGAGLIRKVWERVDATKGGPAQASVPALGNVLNHITHTKNALPTALTSYAVANLDPAAAYPEGSAWPRPAFGARARLARARGRRELTVHVNHLAAQDVVLRPPAQGAARRVRLTVTGPRRRDRVVLTVRRDDGTTTHRAIQLHHGVGTATSTFSPATVSSLVVTVVNTSTRYVCNRGSLLSCGGLPKDDHMRFTVSARVMPPKVPAKRSLTKGSIKKRTGVDRRAALDRRR